MSLAQLPASTIKLIGSSQVITSVSSVVKELMENSIDAAASSINIRLDKYGLEKIEVKDDGCGIHRSDTAVMCRAHYTSKISDFNDLNNLKSYGFRGEALNSLSAVAQVTIATKTADDDVGMSYTFDTEGYITAAKVCPLVQGTIVTVTDLFKNLPVRKQYMSGSQKARQDLKNIETIVKSLAVIHPRLRVTLSHNKFMIWQKTSVSNLRQSVLQVLPHSIVKQLHYINHVLQSLKLEMLIPKQECDIATVCTSSPSDSSYVFINLRPVLDKKIEKAVSNRIFQYFGHYVPNQKYPIFYISLILPQEMLDVNLEPNKTRVFIQDQDQVINCIEEELSLYYQKPLLNEELEDSDSEVVKPSKKSKLNSNRIIEENHMGNENSIVGNIEQECKVPEQYCVSIITTESEGNVGSEAVEEVTLSQWSRGDVGVGCNPVQICSSDNTLRTQTPQSCSMNMTEHSVASQMGRKEMAAFTTFAKEMRSKILKETPGMTFTKVAGELASKWRTLQSDEKHKYEVEAAKNEKEKKRKKCQNESSSEAQRPVVQSLTNAEVKTSAVELDVTISDLRNICGNYQTFRDSHIDEEFVLINRLESSSLWLYHNGHDLDIVCSLRLQEAVTFHKYLAEFKVPLKHCDSQICVTQQDLSTDLWDVLINMECENNIVTDTRISHNGFGLEIIREPIPKFLVTHVALNIKYYGVEDLQELLQLIRTQRGVNHPDSLIHVRPIKVKNFLRNEAFRNSCLSEKASDLATVEELLRFWVKNVKPYLDVCVHDHLVTFNLQKLCSMLGFNAHICPCTSK